MHFTVFFQVTSSFNSDLSLDSSDKVILRGNEGIEMDGMEISLKADGDIDLTTVCV